VHYQVGPYLLTRCRYVLVDLPRRKQDQKQQTDNQKIKTGNQINFYRNQIQINRYNEKLKAKGIKIQITVLHMMNYTKNSHVKLL